MLLNTAQEQNPNSLVKQMPAPDVPTKKYVHPIYQKALTQPCRSSASECRM
jgi:hypothetical protein